MFCRCVPFFFDSILSLLYALIDNKGENWRMFKEKIPLRHDIFVTFLFQGIG